MSLFDRSKKGKKEDTKTAENGIAANARQELSDEQMSSQAEEPVLYEESGGVTKAQAIEIIQGLPFAPDQSPVGVTGGRHNYGLISCPGYILIFFNQDNEHLMKIDKRDFMPLECIIEHANYYAVQGDFEAATDCLIEGLEKNQGADENWTLYCSAGEVFWTLRQIELARNMFLKAYQCKDCCQKAHVLCQAAAASCILRDPNTGFALYHKALEEEPESLEALHDLGGFHWDMGELDKAAEYYFAVLKKDPTYYASYEEVSNLFSQLGNTVWPGPFMTCFTKKNPLPAEKLATAEADMLMLLAKQ